MTNQTIYSCTQCDYETTNKYTYGRHLKTKIHLRRLNSGMKDLIYRCSHTECDYETKNKSNFNRHIKTHNDVIIHTLKCVYCNLTFRDKQNANIHKKSLFHGKKTTKLFKDEINKLDQKDYMMKTINGENAWHHKKRLIRQKIRQEAFIKVKIEVPKVCKKIKEKKDDKNNKKLSLKELEEIKENYDHYDSSIVSNLFFTHPLQNEIEDFKNQFEELEKNKSNNENYQNDLFDFILELTDDIICSLDMM